MRILDDAARRNVKELLVLTGERPEDNETVARRLAAYGHDGLTISSLGNVSVRDYGSLWITPTRKLPSTSRPGACLGLRLRAGS